MTEQPNSLSTTDAPLLQERPVSGPPENGPDFKISDRCAYLLVCAGVGLVIGLFVGRPLVRANATASWPSTTGTIAKSSYTTTQTVRPSVTRCRPEVEYSYRIPGGRGTITSKRVSANGLIFTSERGVKAFLAHRNPGMTVPVYYNPEDPADAVLVTGITRFDSVMHWLLYVVFQIVVTAVLLALFASCTLVAALFRNRPR